MQICLCSISSFLKCHINIAFTYKGVLSVGDDVGFNSKIHSNMLCADVIGDGGSCLVRKVIKLKTSMDIALSRE